jgi:hypothetical protein
MNKQDSAAAVKRENQEPEPQPTRSQPLPEGFENPPPGEAGHKCTDLKKRYRPDWVCIYIDNTHGVAGRLPINRTGKDGKPVLWNVRTGMWVDVPRDIYENLASIKYDEVEYDPNATNPLYKDRGEVVRKTRPRFQISVRLSD